MKLRPLFALLTSVAMLHLSVGTGEAACLAPQAAGHHSARSADPAARATRMDHHVMASVESVVEPAAAADPVLKADAPPCDAPTQHHCCDAVAGCSMSGAVTSERAVLASGLAPAARIRDARHDAPASFAPAPELPPPKA